MSAMQAQINEVSEEAAMRAAKVIQREQERVFNKASFKRDKRSHIYKNANAGLITIKMQKVHPSRFKVEVGFDTPTLRAYPELLEIEFGRPGKSPRYSKKTDKLKRKKGVFPEAAVVMPIRAGFQLAKDEAYGEYDEQMTEAIKKVWDDPDTWFTPIFRR